MRFQLIRVSGVVTGVGFIEKVEGGNYSTCVCSTLFDTGNDEDDAAKSEEWATIICHALNDKYYKP